MNRDHLVEAMNLLVEVTWDRFVESDGYTAVYGWIVRTDGDRDFVLLQQHGDGRPWMVTSSAKHSKEFGARLNPHIDCRQVYKSKRFGRRIVNVKGKP